MVKQPPEPSIQIDGWSVRLVSLVQLGFLITFLIAVISAWFNLANNQMELNRKQEYLSQQINEVARLAERNRQEGLGDVKDIQAKIEKLYVDGARLDQQIVNLNLLLGDLRKLIDKTGSLELKSTPRFGWKIDEVPR